MESPTHKLVLLSTVIMVLSASQLLSYWSWSIMSASGIAFSDNVQARSRNFGVIGSPADAAGIMNFYWLFGNQTISYLTLSPTEVTRFQDVDCFNGLVIFTKHAGYNASAIRQFAQTRPVIVHMQDFCTNLYPSLNGSIQTVNTATVTYAMDWGNFRNGDLVEMRNETGNTDTLTTVSASSLAGYANVTVIARYDAGRVAFFCMNGTKANSGFYVMDLDATTPETEWTGIWHVFPIVKMVQDFPTGTYARWMANGQTWWNLTWVYSQIDTIVNGNRDVARKQIIGHSVTGREIPAMFIGNGTRYAIIDGSIHGNEKTGTFACLRTAELLIQYYHSDPSWRSRLTQYTVIIVPVLNPDGFASNTRENANGVNLNRQFPPQGTTTEPEAWALRYLMGNYTPTVYVNMHEGYYWYPLHMIYGAYLQGTNLTLTVNTLQLANQTFAGLNHWGWFTDNGAHTWIGKVNTIVAGGGEPGMASDYASWAYGTSSTILETFVWSDAYGARQCLWGLDYYPAVTLALIQDIPR